MKEILLPFCKRLRTGDDAQICFELPQSVRELVWHLIRQAHDKGIESFRVRIASPWNPRTTGWYSQNHHINGHIQQICIETGNSFSAVKERMKELAIDMGYPIETLPDGEARPKGEAEISTVEAGYLIDTIHRFAAEWGINLVEE